MGNTALVVVDMQNAFIDPDAGAPVADAWRVLAAVNRWVGEATSTGWPVLLTRDVDPTGRTASDAELHPDLDASGTVVDKGPGAAGGFSGFVLSTPAARGPGEGGLSDLAPRLARTGVTDLVVVGLAADVCVAATARDARRLGYRVAIDLGATAFVHAHPDGDDAALGDLRAAGVRLLGEEAP